MRFLVAFLASAAAAFAQGDFATPYTFTTLAGHPWGAGCSDGVGGDAQFSRPGGVAVDGSGNVYVADTQNDTIRRITPAGVQPATAAAMADAGAFSLPAGSADSALIVTLPPGPYTVQVAGAGAGTGVALLEIYEIRRSPGPAGGQVLCPDREKWGFSAGTGPS